MSDIETILDKIRCNSALLSNYHRKRYLVLKGRLKYYRLPIIVLSALNSVGAVSLQGFLGQTYISLINMFMSLIVGIIGSIELFYGITRQMEVELVGSRDFYVLSCDIYKWLSLEKSHRNIEAKIFLDESYGRYIKLIESSIILKKKVEDKMQPIEVAPHLPSIPSSTSVDLFVDTSSEDSP